MDMRQNQMKYWEISTNQRNSDFIAVLHLDSCWKVFNTMSYSCICKSNEILDSFVIDFFVFL